MPIRVYNYMFENIKTIIMNKTIKSETNPGEISRKHLINTHDLEYLIERVLHSGYIKNADPLSLIISAKVGAGKTELGHARRNRNESE